MKAAALMGRLANGNEADAGHVIHMVSDDIGHYGHGKALCGAQPGRRSGGWDTYHFVDSKPTCARCARKLQ